MRFMGSSTSKIRLQPGLCPGPRWGAYSTPPDPLAGGEEARCPLSKNPSPPPLSALRASRFGPSGLKLIAPQTQNQTSPMGGGKSAGPIKIRLLRPCIIHPTTEKTRSDGGNTKKHSAGDPEKVSYVLIAISLSTANCEPIFIIFGTCTVGNMVNHGRKL